MTRNTLLALGGGALSALLYVSTLAGSLGALFLVLMAALPLFLVGLSRGLGARGALIAGGCGTLLVALAAGPWVAGNFALAEAVPAYCFVRQAALGRTQADGSVEWYPEGRLVALLSLYAAVAFVAFMIAFANAPGGLEGELETLFRSMGNAFGLAQAPAAAQNMMRELVSLLPGLGAGAWVLIVTGNAWLAQGLLVRGHYNLRPTQPLLAYALPKPLAIAVALAAAAGLLFPDTVGFAGKNLCLILAMPYVFAGVALMHALILRTSARRGAMVGLYTSLAVAVVVLSWFAILALAGLGYIDQIAGLKGRLVRPGSGPSAGPGPNGSQE
ncbi:MAG TPA: DUF2232 domain-containing protein [Alphaproteobacteria bacterium]|nr:DUF2232 domain-containing protein [Alphaproteobacteria bacterium]